MRRKSPPPSTAHAGTPRTGADLLPERCGYCAAHSGVFSRRCPRALRHEPHEPKSDLLDQGVLYRAVRAAHRAEGPASYEVLDLDVMGEPDRAPCI